MIEGTEVRILSKYGITIKSLLSLSLHEDVLYIFWRIHPEKLGCELIFLLSVSISASNNKILNLLFIDFDLSIEFETEIACNLSFSILSSLIVEASSNDKEFLLQNACSNYYLSLRNTSFQLAAKQELLYQLITSLQNREGSVLMEKILFKTVSSLLKSGFKKWTKFVHHENLELMNKDKARWRLHAHANQDLDLQAWYHAVFYHEVYRLRGPFWFRDAVLPVYRNSYDLVDNTLTPLEEAALAHVLCSPETSYGDVAGQMFVVQAIVKPELFTVFQRLAAQGSQVIKYPRTGRPAKKMFRFSFVEGCIYLTWKGKFGNQGVDLSEVSEVVSGITTEVLRRSAHASKTDLYLSLICAGRSVDLCLETVEERNEWRDLLELLVKKEHGQLSGLGGLLRDDCKTAAESLFLFAALGEGPLSVPMRKEILKLSK